MNNKCPDRPLVVKCSFNGKHKRITFQSARNCTYDLLRHKVAQAFSLFGTAYIISWRDDDGEITSVHSNDDIIDAVSYFNTGDDAPLSSAASILSGRSFTSRRITIRFDVNMEYEGPSLSDTSSLASFDDFRGRNASQHSFSNFTSPQVEPEDDSVTVSSKDFSSNSLRRTPPSQISNPFDGENDASSPDFTFSDGSLVSNAIDRYPEDPSAVLEKLKLQDALSDSSSVHRDIGGNARGQAWLKEQEERVIVSKLGMLPQPSEADDASFSLNDPLDGDLALERNNRGSYYYTYTASSHEESPYPEVGLNENGYPPEQIQLRPSSMHLNWLATQQANARHEPRPSPSLPSLNTHNSDPLPTKRSSGFLDDPFAYESKDLPFVPLPEPPEHILTDCSNCGLMLNTIRYVCSTCGEKEPKQRMTANKGKGREATGSPLPHQHYPPRVLHNLPSLSSFPSIFNLRRHGGYPPTNQSNTTPRVSVTIGYELCPACIDTAGVQHAVLAAAPGPAVPSSPEDPQQALHWRKAAPKKGHLRHAYHEKLWGQRGWENVVQEESVVSACSTCTAVTSSQRYKCAVCDKISLCRACYSQVHDIHPSHPFILVPDRPKRSVSEPDFMGNQNFDPGEEQSMKHPGVRCFHCMRDIFGARFHCAICPDVDICSNCESAGLPGDLHSSEGGHDSSHILIKIPYPLGTTQVQNASRRAIFLWKGRDAASVGYSAVGPQPSQDLADYARTVVGTGSPSTTLLDSPDNHQLSCNSCHLPIVGVRYQCAHCPSIPASFNLCANCESRSHIIHDPMHIFFKLPRPVQRPIESTYPLLPQLYRVPAGASTHLIRQSDPRAYLKQLKHESAICDRCMDRIQGEWFHCVYCPQDLCETCEALDTHNDMHFFVAFKSNIDMHIFKNFVHLDMSDSRQTPILPYLVYQRS
ncbi:hypothetical protein AN958_06999 [Leucoagaricus sp. SymC.cos]|nr:hypothetical protein AN958_06999 [Leucoagaricus sp. SymC.cos]